MSGQLAAEFDASPETREYRVAAAEGQLLIRLCKFCGKFHYYPRPICPLCNSADTEWVQARGIGTVYSYSVMRRVAAPYVIAFVTLDEGVSMMTNIIDCAPDAVRIGMKVKLSFQPTADGGKAAMFAPAAAAES